MPIVVINGLMVSKSSFDGSFAGNWVVGYTRMINAGKGTYHDVLLIAMSTQT